eukprot:5347779-Pyramimonas_sp.AAC.1
MPVAPGRDQQLRLVLDDRPDALWSATAARTKSPRGLRVARTPPNDVWRSPTAVTPLALRVNSMLDGNGFTETSPEEALATRSASRRRCERSRAHIGCRAYRP